jgi:hypothetical protein
MVLGVGTAVLLVAALWMLSSLFFCAFVVALWMKYVALQLWLAFWLGCRLWLSIDM